MSTQNRCPRPTDQFGPRYYAVTGIFVRMGANPGGGGVVILKLSPSAPTEESLRATDDVLNPLRAVQPGTVITLVSYRASSQSGANPPFSCLEVDGAMTTGTSG